MKSFFRTPLVCPLLVGLCALMLLMPGCRGCTDGQTAQQQAAQKKAEQERKKKQEEEKKKQKKPPMEIGALRPLPSQSDNPRLFIKPGHWTPLSQEMKRNYDDWVGNVTRSPVDARNQPIPLLRTRFSLRSQRPVALSKGQLKDIQSVLFVPPVAGNIRLQSQIQGRDAVAGGQDFSDIPTRMQPHQYNFVVLAASPASYGRLGSLRSVNAPLHQIEVDVQSSPAAWPARMQYRVVAPELGDRAPLPDSLFGLTSVAYVLWDEVNPSIFDAGQRAALVDWLQWGGQLIISGPDSLALLRGSFLEPYLPAVGTDAWDISRQDLQPMLDAWGVGTRGAALTLSRPWSGIRLKVVEDQAERRASARPVARATSQLRCGELFAERRVGRGRVIVSAMQLNQRELQNWQNGYECLMNAVVLRRPPRKFRNDNYGSFSGESDNDFREDTIAVEWATGDAVAIDASLNSQLRIMSRDTYKDRSAWKFHKSTSDAGGMVGQFGNQFSDQTTSLAPPTYPGGVGGWDDFSQVSSAARDALREAAGVTVPGAGFVVGCVAIYLVVLAPLNWIVFRAVGRVELAWLAAPLIAVAGTLVVVKQAQLDIGFVRAQTEVALFETQPGYPRGCLTRFTGVYTSLATNYNMTFDDPTAVAAPFASRADFKLLSGQRISQVTYDRQAKAQLLGLAVSSNSTEMVHSEEMHDTSGAVRLGKSSSGLLQIQNPTDWSLRHTVVVHRPVDKSPAKKGAKPAPPTLLGCWIGDLPRRESAFLSWSPVAQADEAAPYADRRLQDAGRGGGKLLNLEPLWRVALDPVHLEPGEYRCVARIDQSLPGMSIAPKAAQQTGATLWVAHLQYEIPPPPKPDKNAPVDFRKTD